MEMKRFRESKRERRERRERKRAREGGVGLSEAKIKTQVYQKMNQKITILHGQRERETERQTERVTDR